MWQPLLHPTFTCMRAGRERLELAGLPRGHHVSNRDGIGWKYWDQEAERPITVGWVSLASVHTTPDYCCIWGDGC